MLRKKYELLKAATVWVRKLEEPTLSTEGFDEAIQPVLTQPLERLTATQHTARLRFEPRWNQWNVNRALLASLTSALLMALLLQL